MYVAIFPTIAVQRARQRYTRLRATGDIETYRYEALGTGFTIDLEVDPDGFVIDYPGIWQRVHPPRSRRAA